jgi:general secretion pathway protein A
MYETFFNIREEPFGVTPDPKFLYMSHNHENALANLSYGIERRRGFIMITGEIGTGKTTICRVLLKNLKDVDTALIINPTLTGGGLLSAIVEDFGLESKRSIKDRIDTINRFLLQRRAEGKNAIVIIDECQRLSRQALEMVRLLSNLETESEKLLQIILVGQPELREKLESAELRQLAQRLVVRYHLEPLGRREVDEYISHRLEVAGSSEEYVKFSSEALEMIFSYTGGFPRLINILCDRILMAAYVEEKRVIDSAVVENAIEDVEGIGRRGASDSPRSHGSLRTYGMPKVRGAEV